MAETSDILDQTMDVGGYNITMQMFLFFLVVVVIAYYMSRPAKDSTGATQPGYYW